MAMKNATKATCPECDRNDVLVCKSCGLCAKCSENKHADCDKKEEPIVKIHAEGIISSS